MATSISSHNIPLPLPSSFPPVYGARYSETTANAATGATYGSLVAMEDSQDDDPESILDEHVQRVMKTPGCQSPGAANSTLGGGRHTPPKSSRSPDGGIGLPHYPPHRGGGHGLSTAGVKGIRLAKGELGLVGILIIYFLLLLPFPLYGDGDDGILPSIMLYFCATDLRV